MTLLALLALVIATPADAGSLTRDQRQSQAEIVRVFGQKAEPALRVAWCESTWRSRAWSSTSDAGVFQINYAAHHRAGESVEAFKRKWFDRRTNVAFAWRLSQGGTDWGPWTCRWAAG